MDIMSQAGFCGRERIAPFIAAVRPILTAKEEMPEALADRTQPDRQYDAVPAHHPVAYDDRGKRKKDCFQDDGKVKTGLFGRADWRSKVREGSRLVSFGPPLSWNLCPSCAR
jgi:hypothetical protein